jgi:hypothetical protein
MPNIGHSSEYQFVFHVAELMLRKFVSFVIRISLQIYKCESFGFSRIMPKDVQFVMGCVPNLISQ